MAGEIILYDRHPGHGGMTRDGSTPTWDINPNPVWIISMKQTTDATTTRNCLVKRDVSLSTAVEGFIRVKI